MTPNNLLDEVKSRFVQLLHDEEPKLIPLLKRALGAYQDKAGVIKKMELVAGVMTFEKPADQLQRVNCVDAQGKFIRLRESETHTTLSPNDLKTAVYPLQYSYLVNLRDVDLNTYQLPANAVPILLDYLETLIKIPNSERLRRVSIAGNLDTSDIPTLADLNEEKRLLEEQMKQNKCLLPFTMV